MHYCTLTYQFCSYIYYLNFAKLLSVHLLFSNASKHIVPRNPFLCTSVSVSPDFLHAAITRLKIYGFFIKLALTDLHQSMSL